MKSALFANASLSLLLACSVVPAAYADAKNNNKMDGLDGMLVELDLVDENFKYTDPQSVEVIFQIITNKIAKDLKYNNKKDGLRNTNMEIGAYSMTMALQDMSLLDRGEIEVRKLKMTEPAIIEKFCRKIYTSKFFRANDYVVDIEYIDARGDTVGHFILNKEVCP